MPALETADAAEQQFFTRKTDPAVVALLTNDNKTKNGFLHRSKLAMKAIDHVTFWRDPALEGIETCRVSGSRHVFPDHAHDGIYAIGLMETGGSYCLGPQKSDSLVAAGQVALINPSMQSGTVHQARAAWWRPGRAPGHGISIGNPGPEDVP